MIEFLVAWLATETGQVITSGAMGGVVRWLTLREPVTSGFASIVVGAICAMYLGPLVQPMLAPFVQVVLTEQVSRASFTGFIVGIGGISLSGFVIDMIRAKRRETAPRISVDDQRVLGAKLREIYGEIDVERRSTDD